MRITSAGNVGIGEPAPANKLHVNTGDDEIAKFEGTDHALISIQGTTDSERSINFLSGDHISNNLDWKIGLDNNNDSVGALTDFIFKTANNAAPKVRIDTSGNMTVAGTFSATTKSFVITHPTKPGKTLHHGSLEGPEHGVYIRGRLEGDTIELPDYWLGLVDEDTITVQLTPNKGFQQIYVDHIEDNKVYVGTQTDTPIDCFYFIQAERKDVEQMIVEGDA